MQLLTIIMTEVEPKVHGPIFPDLFVPRSPSLTMAILRFLIFPPTISPDLGEHQFQKYAE